MTAERLGYLWDLLRGAESPAGAVVNAFILLIFVAGVFDVTVALWRLGRERKALRGAQGRVADLLAAAGAGTRDVHSLLGLERDTLVGRRVEGVLKLRGAGLGDSEMLRQAGVGRLAGYGALARYCGAILTLLGLLGTVLGLSFALFNIQQALGQADDPAALKELIRALGQTLLGMRTAFGCTLAGLSGALLLSALNHGLSRRQSRFAVDLEDFAACELLPAMARVEPGADDAARLFVELLVKAGADLERVQSQVTTAAGRFDEASQRLAASAQEFGASAGVFERSVGELAGGQRAVAAALSDTGEALRALREQGETAKDFLAALTERHQGALQAMMSENREAMGDLVGAERAALAAFSDLALDVRGQLADAGPAETAKTLAAAVEASNAVLKDLRGLAARFEPALLEGQHRSTAAVAAALAEIQTAVTRTLAELSQQHQEATASQVRGLENALQAVLTRHAEGFQQVVEQNREGVGSMAREQTSALRAFSDLVVDAHSLMGPLFERPSAAGNGQGHPARPSQP